MSRGWAQILAGAWLGTWGNLAEAHVFEHPKILRVGLQPDRLLVSVTYDLNPGRQSLEARGLFDRNQDGTLDPEEQVKLAKFLEDSAMLFLKVKIGGQAVRLERLEASPHQLDRPSGSSESLGISLLYAAPLPPEGGVLELEDRDRDKQKHVPVVVDLAPTWRVALASQGELSNATHQIQRVMLSAGSPLRLQVERRENSPPAPNLK
ncbi:MAG: hypothetical protein IPG45_08820 [Deltaproteobacteria bacterium]|jgi:hypothetical protein|nr:hypothetical protein [Deltaproteobacteria bacterium]